MAEDSYMIPVIFHNLKGYDSHLILQYVTHVYAPNSIDVVPTTSEKFLSFQIGNLRFIESLQFLIASLDTLVQSLAADGRDKFSRTARHYPYSDLVFAKGNYPYEYMDGRDKFLLTEFPPIDAFYSSLSEETITPEEYERAQKVWSEFNIENMQQYHDLYLNLDVLLLADVFENFRQTCIMDYGLYPAHYYTLPGFAFNACLKFTEQELDLFTDSEKFLLSRTLFAAELASWVTGTPKRIILSFPITITTPHSYLTYLNSNNLYVGAMSEALPIEDFTFLTEDEVASFDLDATTKSDDYGHNLEHLHDSYSDYPLEKSSFL